MNICCVFTGSYFRFYWVASMCMTLKESLLKGLVHILQVNVHQKMCHTLVLTLTCFCHPEMFICMASKHGSISNQLHHSKCLKFILFLILCHICQILNITLSHLTRSYTAVCAQCQDNSMGKSKILKVSETKVHSEPWNSNFILNSSSQKKCHKMKLDIKLLHRNYKAMKVVL